MKIDHIGYVTKNIKKYSKFLVDMMGYKSLTSEIVEPAHNVKVKFFSIANNSYPLLELIEPLNKKSKVNNFLYNRGECIHHLAYEVSNVEKEMKNFIKKNFIPISNIVPGAGHNNTPSVWLYTPTGDLIELLQKQKRNNSFKRLTKKYLKIK